MEINGRQGTVKGLDLFSTRLADPDNLNVFVPNAKAFGEIIINQTSPASRRVQLDFTIDFDDDVDRALALLLECAAADSRVVAKPEPWARLTELKDRGATVSLRAWFSPEDYWDGRFDLTKAVKDRLEAEGFTFPYPHQVAVAARPFRAPRSKTGGAGDGGDKTPAVRAHAAKIRQPLRRKPVVKRAPKRGSPSPRPTKAGSAARG